MKNFAILLIILASCSGNIKKENISLNEDSLKKDEFIKIWRNDTTGFIYPGKSLELLEKIYYKYELKNRSRREVNYILDDYKGTNTDYIVKSYRCCGWFWDENGDGKIDSTKEFRLNNIDLLYKNDKLDTFQLLDR
jgi:hypothetical protein